MDQNITCPNCEELTSRFEDNCSSCGAEIVQGV